MSEQMDDNHPSSSSSDYLHQRATECEATPDNTCTRPSTAQARRKLSASFVNIPASTSQLDYTHEVKSHHLDQTPSRIPVLSSTLSSRVNPPTLLTRTELPLARPDRSPLPSVGSSSFSTITPHFMIHPSPNGPQESPCLLATPGQVDHSTYVGSPSSPWNTRFAPASPVTTHLEYPAGPSNSTEASTSQSAIHREATLDAHVGRKRERARSLPGTPPTRKRYRSGARILHSARVPPGRSPRSPQLLQPLGAANEVTPDQGGNSSRSRTRTAPLYRSTPLTSSIGAYATREQGMTPSSLGRRLDITEYIPPLQPPITIHTISNLEAHELLKGVQVRHDLQFEDVAIRSPTVSTRKALHRARQQIEGSEVSPPNITRANQYHQSIMYWQTVEIEVTTGCRCVAWQVRNDHRSGAPGLIVQFRRSTGCVCGGWMPEMNAETWRNRIGTSAYPSRFMEMLTRESQPCRVALWWLIFPRASLDSCGIDGLNCPQSWSDPVLRFRGHRSRTSATAGCLDSRRSCTEPTSLGRF